MALAFFNASALKKAFMESILLVRTEDKESKTDREDYKATKSIYMKNGFY